MMFCFSPRNSPTPTAILASGTVYRDGTATFAEWYVMPRAKLSDLKPGPYRFRYTDAEGRTLRQIEVDVSFELEVLPAPGHTGPSRFTLPQASFVWTIPYVAGVKKIALLLDNAVLAARFGEEQCWARFSDQLALPILGSR